MLYVACVVDAKYPGVLATLRLAAMLLPRNRRILRLKDPAETLVPREVDLLVPDLLKHQLGLGSPSSTNASPKPPRLWRRQHPAVAEEAVMGKGWWLQQPRREPLEGQQEQQALAGTAVQCQCYLLDPERLLSGPYTQNISRPPPAAASEHRGHIPSPRRESPRLRHGRYRSLPEAIANI